MYRMLLVFKIEVSLVLRKSNTIFCKFESISKNTNNLNYFLTNNKFLIIDVDMIIFIDHLMFMSSDNKY